MGKRAKADRGLIVTNWDGNIQSRPARIARPTSLDELRVIVRDTKRYPSPLRAVGGNYSGTRCASADDGTLVDMSLMNKVIEVGQDFVRVQAGARIIDVARELRAHGLEFPVSMELGNASIGSASCGCTRDAALPGEFGQLSSYVLGMKLVTPEGQVLVADQRKPELMKLLRSSYGLLGVVCEVTLRVRPRATWKVSFERFDLETFFEVYPLLVKRKEAMKISLMPFRNLVITEFRRPDGGIDTSRGMAWRMRNWSTRSLEPAVGSCLTRGVPVKALRYRMIDGFQSTLHAGLSRMLSGASSSTSSPMQVYPRKAGLRRVCYSAWAFPQEQYGRVLKDYVEFCHRYYQSFGYRCNLTTHGYRVARDANSLFSYSASGPVFTLEPASTGDAGWEDFLVDFNDFCSDNEGVPLLNQTRAVTQEQVRRAFGERLRSFGGLRKRVDPHNRFLNPYYLQLLG